MTAEQSGSPVASNLLSQEEMLAAEETAIYGSNVKPEHVSGVALSGGGVRSAIVALGVLQVLAEKDLLQRFQYMSTVSGGGYIGAALSWFWSDLRLSGEKQPLSDRSTFGATADDFPFQDESKRRVSASTQILYRNLPIREKAVRNLEFLRNHGSYLTTGDGIGVGGLIVAVVRTVLTSLAVWLPLLILIFLFGEVFDDTFCPQDDDRSDWCKFAIRSRPLFTFVIGLSSLLVAIFVLAVISVALIDPSQGRRSPRGRLGLLLRLSAVLLAPAVFGGAAVFIGTGSRLEALAGTLEALMALFSALAFIWGATELCSSNPNYWLRRTFDLVSSKMLLTFVVTLFIGSFPFIGAHARAGATMVDVIGGIVPISIVGMMSLLSGVCTALYGYYLKAKSIAPGLAGQVLGVGGALFFLSGMLLMAFVTAHEIAFKSLDTYSVILWNCSFFISITIGIFGNVNASGLHRFYRDRLMETFMPMSEAIEKGLARKSTNADNLSVDAMWDVNVDPGRRPYHLINTTAILVKDKAAKLTVRGGDNFVVSGEFVGSSATGWMRTSKYIELNGPLSIASAMAASGAAANAHAGYIGTGLTRDRFISAAMSVLNIRLGLWVGNPAVLANSKQAARWPRHATYFGPALTAGIFNGGHDSKSRFLELSDGGHFENLGLYELARRKVDLALIVDAEQDQSISLSSLVSATNRIREDFGTEIRFHEGRGPEMLIGHESRQYPSGVLIAESPFVVGKIIYSPTHVGTLIYIKSNMFSGLEFVTDGYRASNPDFPHQSTIDQFFDPDQFEAYRDLGKKSCAMMIDKLDLGRTMNDREEIFNQFKAFADANVKARALTASAVVRKRPGFAYPKR